MALFQNDEIFSNFYSSTDFKIFLYFIQRNHNHQLRINIKKKRHQKACPNLAGGFNWQR